MLTTGGGCVPRLCLVAASSRSILCAPIFGTAVHSPACLNPCSSFTINRVRHGSVTHHARRQVPCSVKCMLSPRQQGQPNTSTLLTYLNLVNDATKWLVSLTAASTLVWRHDIYVTWCFLGSIVTIFFCKALKKVIKIQRPADARKQDPGMPSSHASSLAYLSTYLAVAWHSQPAILAFSGVAFAVLLIPLRVILGYHSIPQVLVGACFGATSAVSWHTLGQQVVLPDLATSSNSRIWLAAATIVALTSYAIAAFRSK